MSTTLVTAKTDTSFRELVRLMLRNGVSAIAVLDAEGRPIGIVTEVDLITKEAYGGGRRTVPAADAYGFRVETDWATKARGLTASAVMSAPVRTVRPDDDLRLAAMYLVANGVRRLAVVDDRGRLVGMVSRRDVLRLFDRTDGDLAVDVAALLEDPILGSEDPTVTASVAEGVVTLHGATDKSAALRLADGVRRHVPGVVAVVSPTDARPFVANRAGSHGS